MAKYFNTAFSLSMLPENYTSQANSVNSFLREISTEEAAELLRRWQGRVKNVANPRHANTLAAITQLLGVNVAEGATGERITLEMGDQVLVAQLNVSALPRETREYTDEEIEEANIRFFLVTV